MRSTAAATGGATRFSASGNINSDVRLKSTFNRLLDDTDIVALGDAVNASIGRYRLFLCVLASVSMLDVSLALDEILPNDSALLACNKWFMTAIAVAGAYAVVRAHRLAAMNLYLQSSLADAQVLPGMFELLIWTPFSIVTLILEIVCWVTIVPPMVELPPNSAFYFIDLVVYLRVYSFVSYWGVTNYLRRGSCRTLAKFAGIDIGWGFALRASFEERPMRSMLVASLICMVPSTLVFMRTEQQSLFTSIYFVLESISAVGYGDVVPHTWQGKLITVVLGMFNVCGLSFFLNLSSSKATLRGDILRFDMLASSFRLAVTRRHVAALVVSRFFLAFSTSARKKFGALFRRSHWKFQLRQSVDRLCAVRKQEVELAKARSALTGSPDPGLEPIDDGLLTVSSRHTFGLGRRLLPSVSSLATIESEERISSVTPPGFVNASGDQRSWALMQLVRRLEILEVRAEKVLAQLTALQGKEACAEASVPAAESSGWMTAGRGGDPHRHYHNFADAVTMASRLMRLPMPAIRHWAHRHHFRLASVAPHAHLTKSDVVYFLLKEAYPNLDLDYPLLSTTVNRMAVYPPRSEASAESLRRSLHGMSRFARRLWAVRNGLTYPPGAEGAGHKWHALHMAHSALFSPRDIPELEVPVHEDVNDMLPAVPLP